MSEHAFDPVGYQVTYEFPPGVEALSQALSAAKAGVAYAGFNMVTVGEDGLSVLASKGPDISRNIEVVGIYLHQSESGFLAKIFVKGESLGLYWERELGYVQDQIIAGIDLFLASDRKLQAEDPCSITAQE